MENQSAKPDAVGLPSRAEGATRQALPQSASVSHEARLRRVNDYQVASLAKPDALAANLGSINSGLMRVALWLDAAIESALESGPRSVERIQRLLPAIDTHLRIARQVDRFAAIEIRAAEVLKPRTDTETGARGRPEMPTPTRSPQGEEPGPG